MAESEREAKDALDRATAMLRVSVESGDSVALFPDECRALRAALLREGQRVEGWIMRDQPIPAHANMDPRYWKRVTVVEHGGSDEGKAGG